MERCVVVLHGRDGPRCKEVEANNLFKAVSKAVNDRRGGECWAHLWWYDSCAMVDVFMKQRHWRVGLSDVGRWSSQRDLNPEFRPVWNTKSDEEREKDGA